MKKEMILMDDFWDLIKNIPTLPLINVDNHDYACLMAQQKIGYPLVCKIWSDDISHKSDVGGVVVGILNRSHLIRTMTEMKEKVSEKQPYAKIKGFTLQKMAPSEGFEMIVGIKQDPQFGHVIMFGLGGIYAEILNDISFKVVPFDKHDALKMIEEIDSYKLFRGCRGSKPVDLQSIVNVIMELQKICVEYPEIEELDINPLMCYHDGCLVIDGRVF